MNTLYLLGQFLIFAVTFGDANGAEISTVFIQVKEFDSISRLDQWHTTMLLRIKKAIQGDEGDLKWSGQWGDHPLHGTLLLPFHFTSVLCNGQVRVFQNSMSKCIAATFLENILISLYCYIDIQLYNIAHIKNLALQFKDLLRFPCYALRGYFWKHGVNRFSRGKFKDTMGIWDSPRVHLQLSLNCNVLELHELYRYNYSVSAAGLCIIIII